MFDSAMPIIPSKMPVGIIGIIGIIGGIVGLPIGTLGTLGIDKRETV